MKCKLLLFPILFLSFSCSNLPIDKENDDFTADEIGVLHNKYLDILLQSDDITTKAESATQLTNIPAMVRTLASRSEVKDYMTEDLINQLISECEKAYMEILPYSTDTLALQTYILQKIEAMGSEKDEAMKVYNSILRYSGEYWQSSGSLETNGARDRIVIAMDAFGGIAGLAMGGAGSIIVAAVMSCLFDSELSEDLENDTESGETGSNE